LETEAPKVKAIVQDPNLSASEKQKKLKTVHSQTDPTGQVDPDPDAVRAMADDPQDSTGTTEEVATEVLHMLDEKVDNA